MLALNVTNKALLPFVHAADGFAIAAEQQPAASLGSEVLDCHAGCHCCSVCVFTYSIQVKVIHGRRRLSRPAVLG